MAYNYLVTAQSPTVVSNSHTGYFNSPDELNTILIKGNNIEIYNIRSGDGLQKINELPFYGRIVQSIMFRPPKCETDHLFLLTQSFSFCIIATDPSSRQIITKASGQLAEEHASQKAASQCLVSIDESSQNILIHIYKGEVLYIQLDESGKLKQHSSAEKIVIQELEILSLTFLYTKSSSSSSTTSAIKSASNDEASTAMISPSDDTNVMNIDHENDDNNNANNDSSNDLAQSLIATSPSGKQKASQVIKEKLSKLKPTKMNEKIKSLRKRSRNHLDQEEKEEEKKQSATSCNAANRSLTGNKLLFCILYQDYRKGRHLKTYYLNARILELEDGPWDTLMVEEGCNRLLSIPPPLCGVLFIGQYSIAYRNGDNCQRVQVPDGDLCCFDLIRHKRPVINIHEEEEEDGDQDDDDINIGDKNDDVSLNQAAFIDGSRWLIGDALNRTLNMLVLKHNEENQVKSLHFDRLGEIVSACTVSYICSGLAFIGSHSGDNQFIEIHEDKDWRKRREQEEAEDAENVDEDDEDDDIAMNANTNTNANTNMDVNVADEQQKEDEYVEVLEEFTNLGPIVDMIAVDLERQGQCQLVTCSGVGRDGSLRVIKNGIGIEEVAEIEMEGIQGLWGLKESSSSTFDKYLITSFISETRVLAMTEEGLEEMEMNGLNSMMRTVHAANVCNDCFVQIGESEINLIDLNSFNLNYQWKCIENGYDSNIKINSCTTNGTQLLCALSGGHLVSLDVINNHEIKCVNKTQFEYEISCVALSPPQATADGDGQQRSLYGAVGMWKDYSIRIFALSNFNVLLKFPLQTDMVPRSVLITNFNNTDEACYLFVGMGDGSLIEAKLEVSSLDKIELVKQKKIPLGTQPVRLIPFQCNGISYVFGGCDRPTVIYLLNNRMFYANVNLPEIIYMTEFNAADFPDCLAMSCQGNLMIGQMDDVQKLHITKIPLHEQPRRIAYNKSASCYLLASQTTTYSSVNQSQRNNRYNRNNYFHPAYNQTVYKLTLRDEQNIEDVLCTKILDPYWNITKIITHQFKCDPHVTYFIITSCLAKPHEKAPSQGKVQIAMVINANDAGSGNNHNNNAVNNDNAQENTGSGTQLKIVHTKLFRGEPTCVRGIGDDYLLIGVRSKIQLFRWMLSSGRMDNDIGVDQDEEDYAFELHHLYTLQNNTYVLDIKVHGDFFIVVDLMKSISMYLLQATGNIEAAVKPRMIDGTLLNEESGGKGAAGFAKQQYAAVINEVARDYDPSWMKCGDLYNDQYCVGIDSFCNFFILKRNIDTLNEDERGRLDVVCRIHWGDDVNVISHGSLVMDIPYDVESTDTSTAKMEVDQNKSGGVAPKKAKKSDKAEMDESDGEENEEEEKDDEKTNSSNKVKSVHVSALRPTDLRKCVFGTIDGAVGVLISIPYARYVVLEKLEKSLRKFVQGLGGLDHEMWRNFKNQTDCKQSVGFLDGDLIETFLNLTNEQQQKVADDMKVDHESLIKIVEEMNRLH